MLHIHCPSILNPPEIICIVKWNEQDVEKSFQILNWYKIHTWLGWDLFFIPTIHFTHVYGIRQYLCKKKHQVELLVIRCLTLSSL